MRLNLQKNLLAGILTLIPMWITWVVFEFILTQLSKFGTPWVRVMAKAVEKSYPSLEQILLNPWFQNGLAIMLTLVVLYLLGLIATRMIGKRLIGLFEALIERIPFIQTVYGATKRLIAALQDRPEGTQRVVLVEFPSREMRAVGFVTRIFIDQHSGQELAAVYVPTTPNPTSGYLEIVPLERVVPTDWSMDEAMTFIISGGAVAPSNLSFDRSGTDIQR